MLSISYWIGRVLWICRVTAHSFWWKKLYQNIRAIFAKWISLRVSYLLLWSGGDEHLIWILIEKSSTFSPFSSNLWSLEKSTIVLVWYAFLLLETTSLFFCSRTILEYICLVFTMWLVYKNKRRKIDICQNINNLIIS